MKYKSVFTFLLLFVSVSAFASHWVNQYSRRDGSIVQGHRSMDPYEAQRSGESYRNNELVPYGSRNSGSSLQNNLTGPANSGGRDSFLGGDVPGSN